MSGVSAWELRRRAYVVQPSSTRRRGAMLEGAGDAFESPIRTVAPAWAGFRSRGPSREMLRHRRDLRLLLATLLP